MIEQIHDILEEPYEKSVKLVMSLGFHPQIDLFNYELYNLDRFRQHVMDCVGALIRFQEVFNKLQEPDEAGAKKRLFWQSLTQVSSLVENKLRANEVLCTLFQSFPDEQKAFDEMQQLEIHNSHIGQSITSNGNTFASCSTSF